MSNARSTPFSVRRFVTWGDCDPAGIIYTPRAIDYACDTVDAWLRDEAKASWWHNRATNSGPGMPTVSVTCDFISILRPDQEVELRFYVRRIGRSSIEFLIEGVALPDRLAFRVKMISCTIDMTTSRATPVPAWLRDKLAACQARCPLPEAPNER